jgi:hypothetical protein
MTLCVSGVIASPCFGASSLLATQSTIEIAFTKLDSATGAPTGGGTLPSSGSWVKCVGGALGNTAYSGGGNCVISVAEEDASGYAFWVGRNAVTGHPWFQIRKDGGVRVWDYLMVNPTSAGAAYWNWSGSINPAMFVVLSDLAGGANTNQLIFNNPTGKHEFIRAYGDNTIGGDGTISAGTLMFDIDGHGRVTLGSLTFSQLDCSASYSCGPPRAWATGSQGGVTTGSPLDGTIVYCSDCTKATPCASGGSGALAKRINAAWDCD